MNLRYLALLPVVVLIGLIFSILFFDFSTAFVVNPPYLLLTLNLIFWTMGTLAIVFISAKSYLKDGSLTILLLSSSIIMFGLSVIISGWVGTFSGPLSIAISNPCLLVASVLQVLSSILSFRQSQETLMPNRKKLLATAYVISLVFVVANSIFVLSGNYPVFFNASGPTLVRQVVLGSTVFFFAVASIIFAVQYFRTKSVPIYWYALAIALLCIGLFSAVEVKTIGDVPTWFGRTTLYVGTIYLVAALFASKHKATAGNDLAGAWAASFKSDRGQISTLFSKMLDAFVYGKAIVDGNGKAVDTLILEVNDAFEQITGIKKENAIGKKASELVPGVQDDPAGWVALYGRVAITGEPAHFENYLTPLKKWYHVSSYSPKKGYFVSIFEDITVRKKAEEALLQAQAKLLDYSHNLENLVEERTKQLKDSERLAAIGATAGMVGHDIRNPLQAITGDVYLAKTELGSIPESEEKQAIQESLTEVEKNVDYINKIVQDLQDFARPLNPRSEESDLKELFEKLISKNGLPKNVTVNMKVSVEARTIKADSYYLNRIMSNLMTNAVQAMPNGGKLTISSQKEANYIVISVEDTGIGIPKDVQNKMFTVMFTTKSKGQGFGLPVVKRMTESLGGSVSFKSIEGKGTTFTIRLPAKGQ